jgi:deoxyribonuclease IV
LRIGIHTSTAGSLEGAAIKAANLGANTFQIFSASPRMWRASHPEPGEIRLLRAARERFDLDPLVIHVNYLVNLASIDPVIRTRSIAAFRGELERAIAIGAEFLVLHPGSYRCSSVEAGLAAFANGLRDAARGLRTGKLAVLLENTAGAGCHLGSRFEELRALRDQAGELTDLPIGYCLDTCHLLAAGFDIASSAGLRAMLQHADATIGLDHVRVIHANDSKFPHGSHVDRHAGIGKGHIGSVAFRRILAHARLRAKPFILETPVVDEGDDQRNLDTLKRLSRRRTA